MALAQLTNTFRLGELNKGRIRLLFTCLLASLLVMTGCATEPVSRVVVTLASPVDPAATTRPSMPTVELSGSPAEIGAAHGRQFGTVIRSMYERFIFSRLTPIQLAEVRLLAAEFEVHMRPEDRQELTALADAAGMNHYDVVLGQCYLDLLPQIGCSTISLPASASPDRIARFGRNLDFESRGLLDKDTTLFIYKPAGKYEFVSIGWPGLIGLVSGMNETGLTLASMEVPRGPRSPDAMPYTLLYRSILEDCKTTDEAIALLERTPRQTANNLMLMDAAGNRAVVEIRPESISVRRGEDSAALISTNHQRNQDQNTPGLCWRYDSLHAAAEANFGRIDARSIEEMLSQVVQGSSGNMTLQSMIFEPANRVLYLAVGHDAPSHGYARIDLHSYFEKLN
jgi:isopenicillin-N N-acyltransferase like protein